MRYFTNSPFERLMMEKPCGQSKAADAAWREYEDNERKKRRCAEGRMRERPPSSMSKRDSCGEAVDIHVENPTKPVDGLGITGEKRFSQKEKEGCLWNGRRNEIRIGSITSESGN